MDDEQREIMFKEAEMIQSCISRMSHDSFLVKGWTLTLVVASLGLLSKSIGWQVMIVALTSIIPFWALDAFFLMTERRYRAKYEYVIGKRTIGDMTNIMDMKPTCPGIENREDCRFWNSFASKTAICFYITTMTLSAIVAITCTG